MLFQFLLLCLSILCVCGTSDDPITCNSTFAHEIFMKDAGLYWCQGSGKGLPLACLAPDASRVDFGSSYWTDSAILVCTLNEDGVLGWTYDACLVLGQRVNVSATIQFELFLYQCIRSADGSLKLNVTGCQWENQSLPLWGKITYMENTYTCDPNDALQLIKVDNNETKSNPNPNKTDSNTDTYKYSNGCEYNGVHWKVGEDKIELGNVWYKCTEDSPNPVIFGCYVNGTKYKIGETFFNNNSLLAFRCQKLDNPLPTAMAYACLEQYQNGSVIDYSPGRVWLSDNGRVMMCVKNGIRVIRRSVGCYYKTDDGEGVLEESCMKIVGSVTVECWPLLQGVMKNNRIKMITNPPATADKKSVKKDGLTSCDSKPLSSVVK